MKFIAPSIAVYFALFVLAYSPVLFAQENNPVLPPEEIRQSFDLPVQNLSESLIALAVQSGLSIVSDIDLLSGYKSTVLNGRYSIEEALDILLVGTPFRYRLDLNDRSIVVRRKQGVDVSLWGRDGGINNPSFAEEVIVTASGISTELGRAPAIATVITADEIKASGINTMRDALEMVPGLHISLSSLSRLDYVYSIRGIHTGFNPHVLLLMNGVPVQHSSQGGRPVLFRLPVTNIEQIEVVRGPGSAIYGADAYSGVINIITKKATDDESTAMGMRYGSFNTSELWLSGSQVAGELAVSYGATYQSSDGDSNRKINSDAQTTLDGIFGTSASLAPGSLSTRYEIFDSYMSTDYQGWNLNLWSWVSKNSGVGAGATQALDSAGRDDNKLFLGDISYQVGDEGDRWKHKFRTSYQYYDTQAKFDLFPAGAVLPIGSDGNISFTDSEGLMVFTDGVKGQPGGTTKDYIAESVTLFSGFFDHRWRLAVGAKRQKLNTREKKNFGPDVIDGTEGVVTGVLTDVSDTEFVFVKDSARSVGYISLQDVWRLSSRWELTAGVRYDEYSDFGGTTNPRFALVWESSERVRTKFLYGRAFRAPSFSEQFMDNNPILLGNPELGPETIDTYELAFLWRAGEKRNVIVSFFDYQSKELVEYMPELSGSIRKAQNARNQKGQGIELETNWRVSSTLNITSNFSYQDSIDEASGSKIADAPQLHAMFELGWRPVPEVSTSLKLNHVANRDRAENDVRDSVPDYTLADFTVRYASPIPNLDVSAGVRNLTNEDAKEPSGKDLLEDYPLESRSYWVSLQYQFN
ncbi:MAG: TonB-dependent receptor [Agarilytica sp.]